MSEQSHEVNFAQLVDSTFQVGGVFHEIVTTVVDNPDLEASEITEFMVPSPEGQEALPPRWTLAERAEKLTALSAGYKEHADEILGSARSLGLLKEANFDVNDVEQVDDTHAIWIAEGGANRTSVVRRQLLIELMTAVCGEDITTRHMYQLGSRRVIPRVWENGSENAEFKVAQEITGDFMPEGDSLTEFELNLASAKQTGYEVIVDTSEDLPETVSRVVSLFKEGVPGLILVHPSERFNKGLQAGFDAIEALEDYEGIDGKQFMIATNGQYRRKDEEQVKNWADQHAHHMLMPVVVGDEAGYNVEHAGQTYTTAERSPAIYANEIAILWRLYNSTNS